MCAVFSLMCPNNARHPPILIRRDAQSAGFHCLHKQNLALRPHNALRLPMLLRRLAARSCRRDVRWLKSGGADRHGLGRARDRIDTRGFLQVLAVLGRRAALRAPIMVHSGAQSPNILLRPHGSLLQGFLWRLVGAVMPPNTALMS